jgi:hypothetical protein
MIDDFRVTYEGQSAPTPRQMEYIRKNPFTSNVQGLLLTFSRHKSTVTYVRHGKLVKYIERQDSNEEDLEAAAAPTPITKGWYCSMADVSVRMASQFKSLDPVHNNGSVWAYWGTETDPITLLHMVSLPSDEKGTFAPVPGARHVYDFKYKAGRSLVRYHLDPSNGMMPVRIQHFYTPEPLFLYYDVQISRYENTAGVFIPVEATLRSCGGKEDAVEIEEHVKATKVEVGVKFEPAEFDIKFPVGTYVTDHIANVSYRVGHFSGEPEDIRDLAKKADALDTKLHDSADASAPEGRRSAQLRTGSRDFGMWGIILIAALIAIIALVYHSRRARG